jgi:hypothetical protein
VTIDRLLVDDGAVEFTSQAGQVLCGRCRKGADPEPVNAYGLVMDRRDTSFLGTADEVTDEEVINAIKSVPCHY